MIVDWSRFGLRPGGHLLLGLYSPAPVRSYGYPYEALNCCGPVSELTVVVILPLGVEWVTLHGTLINTAEPPLQAIAKAKRDSTFSNIL